MLHSSNNIMVITSPQEPALLRDEFISTEVNHRILSLAVIDLEILITLSMETYISTLVLDPHL